MREAFNEKIKNIVDNSNERSDYFTNERYEEIVHEVNEAKRLRDSKMSLSSKQYRKLKRYDIIIIGAYEKLIEKTRETQDEHFRYFCKTDDLFDIIESAHIATGHKRTRGTYLNTIIIKYT
jgi:uncharacterized protein (DUF1015 family)